MSVPVPCLKVFFASSAAWTAKKRHGSINQDSDIALAAYVHRDPRRPMLGRLNMYFLHPFRCLPRTRDVEAPRNEAHILAGISGEGIINGRIEAVNPVNGDI